MISRSALRLSILVALIPVAAEAQVGPLKDPIPAPIPQSPIRVDLKPFVTGLQCPIDLTVVPGKNNRKFIVDETGLVLLFKDEGVKPTPFLDITGIVAQLTPAFRGAPQGLNPGYDERGLLGFAFHPGFSDKKSPGFRTLYTLHNVPVGRQADFPQPVTPPVAAPNCQEVIAEWQVDHEDLDEVNVTSYREVLRFDRPEFNHNGGTIAFGPDGLLYAAFGDGGAGNDVGPGHLPGTGNAQVLSTILGKMIRINPLDPSLTTNKDGAISDNGQYRIPKDNPFFTMSGAVREIYAYGFRNPFRFRFDVEGGRLVMADVGQNNIEEVDIVTAGGDYGWNFQEGTFLFMPTGPNAGTVFTNPNPMPGLIDPVVEYDHFEASANAITRIAIVGGYVYRGNQIPDLVGKYVCADLNGFLFEADLESGDLKQLLNVGMFVKGIGQDDKGELYLTTSTTEGPGTAGTVNGSVLKLVPVHGKN
jgi:glucose/arabinose dehydrogenase